MKKNSLTKSPSNASPSNPITPNICRRLQLPSRKHISFTDIQKVRFDSESDSSDSGINDIQLNRKNSCENIANRFGLEPTQTRFSPAPPKNWMNQRMQLNTNTARKHFYKLPEKQQPSFIKSVIIESSSKAKNVLPPILKTKLPQIKTQSSDISHTRSDNNKIMSEKDIDLSITSSLAQRSESGTIDAVSGYRSDHSTESSESGVSSGQLSSVGSDAESRLNVGDADNNGDVLIHTSATNSVIVEKLDLIKKSINDLRIGHSNGASNTNSEPSSAKVIANDAEQLQDNDRILSQQIFHNLVDSYFSEGETLNSMAMFLDKMEKELEQFNLDNRSHNGHSDNVNLKLKHIQSRIECIAGKISTTLSSSPSSSSHSNSSPDASAEDESSTDSDGSSSSDQLSIHSSASSRSSASSSSNHSPRHNPLMHNFPPRKACRVPSLIL